jgi:hypothetical protein
MILGEFPARDCLLMYLHGLQWRWWISATGAYLGRRSVHTQSYVFLRCILLQQLCAEVRLVSEMTARNMRKSIFNSNLRYSFEQHRSKVFRSDPNAIHLECRQKSTHVMPASRASCPSFAPFNARISLASNSEMTGSATYFHKIILEGAAAVGRSWPVRARTRESADAPRYASQSLYVKRTRLRRLRTEENLTGSGEHAGLYRLKRQSPK